MALAQILCHLYDHAKQYDNDDVCHIKRTVEVAWKYISEWLWKCHNRLVWWLFWGRVKGVYVWKSVSYHGVWMHRQSLHQLLRWERAWHGTEEASKLRKGESAYNPWTHISHKELTYLLRKSISPRSKVLLRMTLGGRLVGVNHHAPPTATQRRQSKINHARTS